MLNRSYFVPENKFWLLFWRNLRVYLSQLEMAKYAIYMMNAGRMDVKNAVLALNGVEKNRYKTANVTKIYR